MIEIEKTGLAGLEEDRKRLVVLKDVFRTAALPIIARALDTNGLKPSTKEEQEEYTNWTVNIIVPLWLQLLNEKMFKGQLELDDRLLPAGEESELLLYSCRTLGIGPDCVDEIFREVARFMGKKLIELTMGLELKPPRGWVCIR